MTAAVALSDLVVGMSRRGTPLASETGLFIALQATEALLDEPMRVSAHEVHISAEGEVSLTPGKSLGEQATVVAVVALLETVISPTPLPVRALIERARSAQVDSLGALRAEIESLLVPLNRSAARRVLGRLARELRKMERAAAPAEQPTPEGGSSDDDARAPVRSPRAVQRPAPSRAATPSALVTVPCAPPASATDTTPDGLVMAASSGIDALDTDPDGRARADVLRTMDDRAWLDAAEHPTDSDEADDAAYGLADEANDEANDEALDAAPTQDDANPAADLELPLERRSGGGGWLAFAVLLALLGAAYAWHCTTTGASAASVIHALARP